MARSARCSAAPVIRPLKKLRDSTCRRFRCRRAGHFATRAEDARTRVFRGFAHTPASIAMSALSSRRSPLAPRENAAAAGVSPPPRSSPEPTPDAVTSRGERPGLTALLAARKFRANAASPSARAAAASAGAKLRAELPPGPLPDSKSPSLSKTLARMRSPDGMTPGDRRRKAEKLREMQAAIDKENADPEVSVPLASPPSASPAPPSGADAASPSPPRSEVSESESPASAAAPRDETDVGSLENVVPADEFVFSTPAPPNASAAIEAPPPTTPLTTGGHVKAAVAAIERENAAREAEARLRAERELVERAAAGGGGGGARASRGGRGAPREGGEGRAPRRRSRRRRASERRGASALTRERERAGARSGGDKDPSLVSRARAGLERDGGGRRGVPRARRPIRTRSRERPPPPRTPRPPPRTPQPTPPPTRSRGAETNDPPKTRRRSASRRRFRRRDPPPRPPPRRGRPTSSRIRSHHPSNRGCTRERPVESARRRTRRRTR